MSREFCINIDKKHITYAVIIFAFFIMPMLLMWKFWIDRPEMTVIAKFQNTPLLTHGLFRRDINAYYRGFNVGRVSKIELSKDQKSVLLYIDIYHKSLKLPKNTIVEIGTEDIAGHQYVKFVYPKYAHKDKLEHGMIIQGSQRGSKSIERIIEKVLDADKIDKILSNLEVITDDIKEILQENKEGIKASLRAGEDVESILEGIREFIDDKTLRQDVKGAIGYSAKTIKEISESFEDAQNAVKENSKIKDIAVLPRNITKISDNLEEMNEKLDKTKKILDHTNYNVCGINNSIKKIPDEVLENSDKTINNLNCFIEGLRKMLSKRFLFWKFLFGKPGSELQECENCVEPKK